MELQLAEGDATPDASVDSGAGESPTAASSGSTRYLIGVAAIAGVAAVAACSCKCSGRKTRDDDYGGVPAMERDPSME